MEISIRDAKAKLTNLIKRAESGEEVVVTRHGKPVATINPVKSVPTANQRRAILRQFLGRAVGRVAPGTTSQTAQDDLYDDVGLPK